MAFLDISLVNDGLRSLLFRFQRVFSSAFWVVIVGRAGQLLTMIGANYSSATIG